MERATHREEYAHTHTPVVKSIQHDEHIISCTENPLHFAIYSQWPERLVHNSFSSEFLTFVAVNIRKRIQITAGRATNTSTFFERRLFIPRWISTTEPRSRASSNNEPLLDGNKRMCADWFDGKIDDFFASSNGPFLWRRGNLRFYRCVCVLDVSTPKIGPTR